MNDKTIYALGFFDGVHLGHQALLAACRALAEIQGCRAGVVTFSSHPDALVQGAAPKLITGASDRRRLLQSFGMETVRELPFDKEMMTMPWLDFFRLLLTRYHAAGIVCGHDFRFGNRGAGNAALLQKACAEQGIPCTVVPEQKLGAITVSSTHIRMLLETGDMETAVSFLGHPHVLTGKVVSGRHIGRTIGVPTANLELPEYLAQPKLGVYAGRACVDGHCYPAVTNIGSRPTVGGHQVRAESWLLGFDGDLYGKDVTLEFYKFLRPEEKFASLDALKAQIQADAAETYRLFR